MVVCEYWFYDVFLRCLFSSRKFREDIHKKSFFLVCQITKRGGEVKPHLTTKQKKHFFMILKKLPEPHETQEK